MYRPSRNTCYESNTTKPNLPSHFINTHFRIIYNSVWSSTDSTMTRIYTGRSGVQILAEARELFHHQNIQTSSSTNPAFNSIKTTAFPVAVKGQGRQSKNSHLCKDKFTNQWSYTSTQPVSLHDKQWDFNFFNSYLCTSLSRGHILSGLTNEPFYTLLASYMHTT